MNWFRWWNKSRKPDTTVPSADPIGQQTSVANSTGTQAAVAKREALLALSRKLSGGSEQVAGEVAQALDQPDAYVEQWGERLLNRCIEEPTPDLAWIALVDALGEHGLVWEIDWKQEIETTLFAVHSLLDCRGWLLPAADRRLEQAIQTEHDTFQQLIELHDWLRPHGLVLGHLDINSDSYVLIVVREDDFTEIGLLAKASGYTLCSFCSGL